MPTVQELLLAARAAKQAGAYAPKPSAAPQEEFSLTGAARELGAFGLNALGVVGNTLDLPGSMVRDVARSITSGQFHNPFDQLLTPFTDVNRATGRQILEDLGMRKNRETGIGGWLSDPGEGARDVGGFVAEVLLDPFGPIGKTLKAPQAINAAFRGAGRAGAAGVKLLPGGSRALQAGGDALEVVNRLRKKYFDNMVGGAFRKTGQEEIAQLNKAVLVDDGESLRFAVDASQLAEDIGWSVRGEVPDILEKHGAIARYIARADARGASSVLEQDLVRDVAGQFPKDMTVRGIRLGIDNKYYALLEGLPDHVQFPVDQLKVVGDSLQTVPDRLMPVLDELRDRAKAQLVHAKHTGVDVGEYTNEYGHAFFHQYMLDAQQHAILLQTGGLRHGHRSAALKIAAGQPEARSSLFEARGTVHGQAGLARIFKEPVWDEVNRAFTDLNETFAPETRIKDLDGQVVQVLPGHVGFQHIQKFADKVGMEPLELWRQLGLDPEKGYAKADDVERALNVFKGKLDAEAARIGLSSGEIPTKRTYSLGLSEVLTDSNVSRIRSNPFIGRGGNAVVHDIPDSPFVARIPNHVKGTVLNDFKEVADVVPGMKVGQAVAENSQGVQILQRQEGMPAGMAVSSGDVAADNLRYVKSVRAAADMPQDAYDRLAINLKRLNEKGFQFDPSKSNNLLIDEAGAEFNIVDVSPGSYKSGLEDMLVTLLGNTHYYKYMDAVGKGVTDQHLARSFGSIFEKASLAAQKAGVPLHLGSSGEYSAKIAGRNLVGADAAKWAERAAAEGRQRAAAAVVKRSTATRPSIYFGKQMFRDLIAGKNTAVPLADTQNLAAGHILPNGQTMRQVSDPKATLESLAKSYVGDSAISKRLSEEAASWGDKPLYEWYVDGERRLFTPDVHTDLSTRFKDNLGKLKKAAEDNPVDQLDAIADSYQLIFKNRYSHLVNERMPYFDDKGLLHFINNAPGPKAGTVEKLTVKEFKSQQDAFEKAKAAVDAAQGPSGPVALRRPVFHTGPHRWEPEPGFPEGRPRLDKIGTGSGKHNHGWGWYSSEAEEVADALKDQLGSGANKYSLYMSEDDVTRMMDYDSSLSSQPSVVDALRQAVDKEQSFVDSFMAASLVDRAKLMRSATVSQKAAVAVRRLDLVSNRSNRLGALENASGRDVLSAVQQITSPRQASEFFRDSGIPGGKFFDDLQPIGAGKPNYVVWDQDVLDRAVKGVDAPAIPDNVASRLASGHMTQRTVNRHQGLAELLRDRENFREFGGFGNNPFVDHHEGTVKLNRSIQTANLLQRFVANSLSNELASRRSSQNFSRVRLAGQEAPGIRVEELMKNMPGLKMDTWLERTFERLKQNGTYAGELTPGIKSEILQHSVDPVVVKEFQDAFKLMNEVPVISDPLKWWDSLSTVMKSGLLATPSRINRDTFSSLVMAWTKGLLGIRDAKHIKNGLAIMRGKPIDWAPDTDEIRALVKQAGGDPDSVAERLRVFKTLWASRSGHGGMHDVLSGDEFARETSGQADRLLDIVPGARGEGIGAQIKRDLSGQSLGQKMNVVTNVAGTWYRDESGRMVQRSTNNALASISNRVSNVFDKGIKLGTMMAVLEKRGKGARFDDAYKEVSKALLNYQSKDFSQFERQVLKRIFPFYGFMSRSVAMVAGELATNPGGRLAQTIRAQRSMQDSEGYTPYELQDTAAVPLGKDAENNLRFLTGFGLMHEDAMQYLAPTQGYRGLLQKLLGSANPMIKQPIEYALNTSTFFEGPMGGRRLDDLDPTMGRLKQLIGERIGLLDPLKPGQSPKPIGGSVTESMVASSPAAAWLRIARTGLDPRKGTVEKLANILTGVRTKTMSPEAQIREIRDRVNAVEIELGARPLTLTVGNKKLEERARAEGDQVKADRLKAARKVLEHIRKASEK